MTSKITTAFKISERAAVFPYVPTMVSGKSNAFVDLRKQPDRISEIREAADRSALKDLIVLINASGSMFTMAADARLDRSEWNKYTRRCYSYVQVAFTQQYLNFSRYSFLDLYKNLKRFIGLQSPESSAELQFEIIQTRYVEEKASGWSLVIWSYGYGNTKPDARSAWESTFQSLMRFFEQRAPIQNENLTETLPWYPQPLSTDEEVERYVFKLEALAEMFRRAAIPEIEIYQMADSVISETESCTKLIPPNVYLRVAECGARWRYTWDNQAPARYLVARANVNRINGHPEPISKMLEAFTNPEATCEIAACHVAEYIDNEVQTRVPKKILSCEYLETVAAISDDSAAEHSEPE